jgi:hypothetical protein
MAQRVNLDAMIKREDLDISDNDPATVKIGSDLKLAELESTSTTFHILRKPDFQRETSNWSPEKIAELVENFLDGDLIPSVIVWRSNKSGKLFVIDGAHRLSALIAWINDDYGDQGISRELFGDQVDDPQHKKIAKKTRDLLVKLGSYQRLKSYVLNPTAAPDEKSLLRARNMGSISITLQEVRGDVAKAERSFLKINQSATLIDPTELTMIQARRKPNAIAARALIHAGEGHQYWGSFNQDAQRSTKELAHAAYDDLFRPILEYPIRTVQLPAAGLALTPDSLDLVFNLVNSVNKAVDVSTKVKPGAWRFPTPDGVGQRDLEDDADGALTTAFVKKVRDATQRVFGPGKGSLALHPGVYCYGATGRFLPTAFFAAIEFVQDLLLHRRFDKFTEAREKFEEFLIGHRHYVNQIAGTYGAQLRGAPATKLMYNVILNNIDLDAAAITAKIQAEPVLAFIRDITEEDRQYGRNFSKDTKNTIYLRAALTNELRCGICNARIRAKTITMDHKDRKEDGGMGTPDNGQIGHPYCNHGYKEKLAHAGVILGE